MNVTWLLSRSSQFSERKLNVYSYLLKANPTEVACALKENLGEYAYHPGGRAGTDQSKSHVSAAMREE